MWKGFSLRASSTNSGTSDVIVILALPIISHIASGQFTNLKLIAKYICTEWGKDTLIHQVKSAFVFFSKFPGTQAMWSTARANIRRKVRPFRKGYPNPMHHTPVDGTISESHYIPIIHGYITTIKSNLDICWFDKWGVPPNGWFLLGKNTIVRNGWWFRGIPISGNLQSYC